MFYNDENTQVATMQDACREYVSNSADEDPTMCSCRGNGWILSQYDSWHSCPVHYNGQRHPEDCDYDDVEVESTSTTEPTYPDRPSKHEEKYVEEEDGMWYVFGVDSGHAYASGSESAMDEWLKENIQNNLPF